MLNINFTGSLLRLPGWESGAATEYRDIQVAALPGGAGVAPAVVQRLFTADVFRQLTTRLVGV
jgi:hypothetical protein